MAQMVKIPDRKCLQCAVKATHEVFNGRFDGRLDGRFDGRFYIYRIPAPRGWFCRKHALAYVADLKSRVS